MTNPVDAAIAAAKEQAAEAAPVTDVATTQPQATAVAQVANTGVAFGLDDLTTGGMSVDDWLKVKEVGLTVGSHAAKFFDDAEFILDTATVQRCDVVKFGKPAQYLKTYDRATCDGVGTWQEALARAKQVDPGVRPYASADLQLEAVEDIVHKDGTKLIEAGQTLGHSTSTTNWGNFSGLMKQLKAQGDLGKKIKVKVGFEAKAKDSYTWGILTFELVEVLED